MTSRKHRIFMKQHEVLKYEYRKLWAACMHAFERGDWELLVDEGHIDRGSRVIDVFDA